jgi:hypothetical protein
VVNPGYYDLGSSMLAYYPFNSGNMLADITGKTGVLMAASTAISASASAPTVLVDGPWAGSYAANFVQGTLPNGQYFRVPAINLPTAYTACAWHMIATGTTKSYQRVWEFGTGRVLNNEFAGIDSSSSNFLYQPYDNSGAVRGSITISNAAANTNTWYHLCIGNSGTTVRVYLNGVSATTSGTLSSSRTVTALTSNFIGATNWPNDKSWNGGIDEVRVFNRLLSGAEMAAVYNFRGDGSTSLLPLSCSPSCSGTGVVGRCTLTGAGVCCGAGTYLMEGVSTACQPCPAGTYAPDGSATACTA